MKKILIVIIVGCIANVTIGQGKDLNSAAYAFNGAQQMLPAAQKSGDFSKVKGKILSAKKYIDAALEKQKETNVHEHWKSFPVKNGGFAHFLKTTNGRSADGGDVSVSKPTNGLLGSANGFLVRF